MNLFLACRPFNKNWQIYPNPGEVCQPAISNQIVWMYWSMNVTTDLYLIFIPVPMLWQSSLKPHKKIGLMLLFSTGLFVVVCATLRCVLIVTDPVHGAQLAGSWAVRETFIAVVTTNLPLIFPLLKVWLTPLLGSLMGFTTVRSSSQKLDEKGSKTFGSTQSWRRRGGPPIANPLTNITFTESEEQIVGGLKLQEIQNNWSDSTATPENDHIPINGNSIRKHVQVSVTVSDRPGGEVPPRKSITGDDGHQPPASDGNGSYAFARGPGRTSHHFGNHS